MDWLVSSSKNNEGMGRRFSCPAYCEHYSWLAKWPSNWLEVSQRSCSPTMLDYIFLTTHLSFFHIRFVTVLTDLFFLNLSFAIISLLLSPHSAMRLYWVDAFFDKIEHSNFDGTNRLSLDRISQISHPFGLTIFEGSKTLNISTNPLLTPQHEVRRWIGGDWDCAVLLLQVMHISRTGVWVA